MWNVEEVGKLVEFLLWNLTLVDDDGVVEVAAFDEVGLKEWHNVAHEDEGAGRSDFVGELVDVVEGRKLTADELRLE